jgi:hypothetical protein
MGHVYAWNAIGKDSSQGRDSFKFDAAREIIRARSPRYSSKLSLVGFKAKHGLFGLRNNGSCTFLVLQGHSWIPENKKRCVRLVHGSISSKVRAFFKIRGGSNPPAGEEP